MPFEDLLPLAQESYDLLQQFRGVPQQQSAFGVERARLVTVTVGLRLEETEIERRRKELEHLVCRMRVALDALLRQERSDLLARFSLHASASFDLLHRLPDDRKPDFAARRAEVVGLPGIEISLEDLRLRLNALPRYCAELRDAAGDDVVVFADLQLCVYELSLLLDRVTDPDDVRGFREELEAIRPREGVPASEVDIRSLLSQGKILRRRMEAHLRSGGEDA